MPRLLRRRPGLLVVLLCAAALGGCKSSRYEVEVQFTTDIDPGNVHFIDLLVLAACPSASAILSGEAPAETPIAEVGLAQAASPLPVLGDLPPGVYGLYGRGFDASCTAVVAGCVGIEVSDDGHGTLVLPLEPTTEQVACAPEAVCVEGECLFDPSDACGAFPCGADAYCTDLPDPAPADASGRTCTPLTDCGPGEYEAAPATIREDRTCATCTTCGPTDLEIVACADGNTDQDRICGVGGAVCTLVANQDGEATNSFLSILDPASGTASTMRVTDDSGDYRSFVQFDVTTETCEEGGSLPAGSTIQSATLRLVRTGGCGICGRGHSLRRVTAGWSEGNVTAGFSLPVAGTASATFDAPDSDAAVLVTSDTLRDDVQNMLDDPADNHGWRIEQSEGPGNEVSPYAWATRENGTSADRPRLIITYAPP